MLSPLLLAQSGDSLLLTGMKSWLSTWPSLTPPGSFGVRVLGSSMKMPKVWAPYLVLAGEGVWLGHSFFLWFLAEEKYLLKFSVLLGCPFSIPFARESRISEGFFFFFLMHLLAFLGFSSFSSKSGIFEAKRNPWDLRNMSFFGSWGPRLLPVFSPPLTVFLRLLHILSRDCCCT